jgi:hypothetical protein
LSRHEQGVDDRHEPQRHRHDPLAGLEYSRDAFEIVMASGPCTKKIRFAASDIRKDRDTIHAKSPAATMCKG